MAANRRGVALIFVVVTLAVMLILATVVLANTASQQQRYKVLSASSALLRFKSEMGGQGQQPSFIGDLTANPSRLSHLYVKLTNADLDSCGQPYAPQEVNQFRGPYHLTPMKRDAEYQIEPGLVVSDTLERSPQTATGNQAGTLSLVMNNVSIELAQDLGRAFDGIDTGVGPQITFTPNGTNPVQVKFNISVQGC